MERLVLARECKRKAQGWKAGNYRKRRSAVTFEPGDLVLVNSRALQGFYGRGRRRKFVTLWLGCFAIR